MWCQEVRNRSKDDREVSEGQGATLKGLSLATAGQFEHQNNDGDRLYNPLSKIGNHEITLIFT